MRIVGEITVNLRFELVKIVATRKTFSWSRFHRAAVGVKFTCQEWNTEGMMLVRYNVSGMADSRCEGWAW